MNEKQLEDALRTWPLEEAPAGFSASVMEKITPQRSHDTLTDMSKFKFRLTWLDYALGFFLSLLPVLVFVAFISLPRKFFLYLEYQLLVFRFPAYEPVLFAVLGGIAAILFLLIFVLSLRLFWPRWVSLY